MRIALAMLLLPVCAAAQSGDASRIAQLLQEASSQAALLKSDLSTLEFIASSATPGQSYAQVVGAYRQHIATLRNQAATLETERKNAPQWQQTTIDRVVPLLREFAVRAAEAIDAIGKNTGDLDNQNFKQYVKLNADLAGELSTLIDGWISLGKTKEELARVSKNIPNRNTGK